MKRRSIDYSVVGSAKYLIFLTDGKGSKRVETGAVSARLAAKNALIEKMRGKQVRICTVKDRKAKYSHYLATLWIDGENFNARIGFVRPSRLKSASGGNLLSEVWR